MEDYQAEHGSVWRYVTGFGLSLALTLLAYATVKHHINSGHTSPTDDMTMVILAVLALVQLFVQLSFFLHLGRESKPRWNLMVFLFAALVVIILVAGSLWIMNHLNYHMSAKQMSQYLKNQESGGI